MPSMTRMRASAVRRSRIGAVAYRRDVKSVRGRRRGRRRRGRRRLGSRARQAVKEAKEAAVGAEHERGVVAVERRPVGLQRAVEGKELPILTERIGIDLDRLRVAVAAHPLTVALRLGEDNGAFALGGGAHRLRRLGALAAILRRLLLALGFHSGVYRLAVLLGQIGAAQTHIDDRYPEILGLVGDLVADLDHDAGALDR